VRLATTVAVVLVLRATTLLGQEFARYQPGTLQAVTAQHDSAVRDVPSNIAEHWAISADDFARRVQVTYTGQHRPIDPVRQELLRQWARGFNRDSSIIAIFQNEYLFREGQVDYWLPVQNVLEEPLAQEAKPDQVIELYVMFIGAHFAHGQLTWLFIVNEFDARVPGQ